MISFQIRADDRRDRSVVIFRDHVHISFLQPCLCFLSVHNISLPSNTLPDYYTTRTLPLPLFSMFLILLPHWSTMKEMV